MAYSPEYSAQGIEYYQIPSFTFTSGTKIPIKIAYRLFGDISSKKKALVPTCYGGLINQTLNFSQPGQALSSYLVIVVAMLGNGESSSPSNTPGFPKSLDYRDCIHAQYALVKQHLSIDALDAVIGFSMGGQQAYYWVCMYPAFVKNTVPICSSARTSGHNYTFLEGPKTALLNSIDYEDGQYGSKRVRPTRGLKAFGRAYCAWLTSGAWFRQRLWEKKLGYKTIEEYIKSQSETSFEHWDPEDVLILAQMWQNGDIGSTRRDGDYTKALADIQARVLVMPSRTDQYFLVADSEVEMQYLKKAELAVIETVWGHIAGGGGNDEDTDWMSKRISEFLG